MIPHVGGVGNAMVQLKEARRKRGSSHWSQKRAVPNSVRVYEQVSAKEDRIKQ
ncbi:hypothetical protein NBRC111894_1037 [Sporolactobacillus inulinus]|uniref:Uncharacterized protein n=1 Tax=Sporolactobacillus inulinus TaxID=2078 RepID=A0A4Y1Z956_9BACL|nr:hypothetical protein NBRC111894_1037 [Sporolactobacillus inulinus]